jgi:hypothetical protein
MWNGSTAVIFMVPPGYSNVLSQKHAAMSQEQSKNPNKISA